MLTKKNKVNHKNILKGELDMKNLENVKALFTNPKAAKIIATISADGEPHAIVAGTVVVLNEDTLAFAETLMKKTSKNLTDTGKIAFSFLNKKLDAVWTCEITKIFNQGANPEAGTQLF